MEEFRRSISYIDIYREQTKSGSVGYLKADVRENRCRLFIHIAGVPVLGREKCEIFSVSKDKAQFYYVGEILIQNGNGEWRLQCRENQFDDHGSKLDDVKAFVFTFPNAQDGKQLRGVAMFTEGTPDFIFAKLEKPEPKAVPKSEEAVKTEEIIEPREILENEENSKSEEISKPKEILDAGETSKDTVRPKQYYAGMHDLLDDCPTIAPFENPEGYKYIKISLEHLSVLKPEYEMIKHNSFLLHAYYNYSYLILGQKGDQYYIGAPGIFHEREQMMASMFGFTGFKNGRDEKAQQGTFGYYMKQVGVNA